MIDGERYTVDNMHTVPYELHPCQFGEKKNDTHLLFGGIHSVYNPLSNWYPCKIKFNGHEFDISEQAYQWAKADYCQDGTAAEKLLYTTSPREAKDLGLTATGLKESDWDKKKNSVMEQILKIKFKKLHGSSEAHIRQRTFSWRKQAGTLTGQLVSLSPEMICLTPRSGKVRTGWANC